MMLPKTEDQVGRSQRKSYKDTIRKSILDYKTILQHKIQNFGEIERNNKNK